MKKHYLYLFVLLAVVGCTAMYRLYNALFDSILERSDVIFIKVEEVQGVHPTRLRIYGATSSSAISVRKIKTKTEESVIVVLVHAGLAKQGESGTFQYELSVPDSVNEVQFGHRSTMIWKRGSGQNAVRGTTAIDKRNYGPTVVQ